MRVGLVQRFYQVGDARRCCKVVRRRLSVGWAVNTGSTNIRPRERLMAAGHTFALEVVHSGGDTFATGSGPILPFALGQGTEPVMFFGDIDQVEIHCKARTSSQAVSGSRLEVSSNRACWRSGLKLPRSSMDFSRISSTFASSDGPPCSCKISPRIYPSLLTLARKGRPDFQYRAGAWAGSHWWSWGRGFPKVWFRKEPSSNLP